MRAPWPSGPSARSTGGAKHRLRVGIEPGVVERALAQDAPHAPLMAAGETAQAELELVDSLDPFAEGVVFSVRPPRKAWKNIGNLSGGEKREREKLEKEKQERERQEARKAEQLKAEQEKRELEEDPEGELRELTGLYMKRGLSHDLAHEVREVGRLAFGIPTP